jgi:acyl carrier protein
MMDTFHLIQEIIVDFLGCEQAEVMPEASVRDDLGADSLDEVELIMKIETEFNISIPHDFEYKTVQDLVDYVDERERDRS